MHHLVSPLSIRTGFLFNWAGEWIVYYNNHYYFLLRINLLLNYFFKSSLTFKKTVKYGLLVNRNRFFILNSIKNLKILIEFINIFKWKRTGHFKLKQKKKKILKKIIKFFKKYDKLLKKNKIKYVFFSKKLRNFLKKRIFYRNIFLKKNYEYNLFFLRIKKRKKKKIKKKKKKKKKKKNEKKKKIKKKKIN